MREAEEWMHSIDRDRYLELPERVREQWYNYVLSQATKRPPLNLKQWMVVNGYTVSYRLDNNSITKVKQAVVPVAYMTFGQGRAITALELQAIPKERRDNVKRMYGIDLFSTHDEALRRRRETAEIHNSKIGVHLAQMIKGDWTFEYEFGTRYVIAKHPKGGIQSVCEVNPSWGVEIASALNLITSTKNQRDALLDALTPSGVTKFEYSSEFRMPVTTRGVDEDGDEYERIDRHTVPWDVIKEIMSFIKKKAEQDAVRRNGAPIKEAPKPSYTRWQKFCLKIARIPV